MFFSFHTSFILFFNNLDELRKYFVFNFLLKNNIYCSNITRDQLNNYKRATKTLKKYYIYQQKCIDGHFINNKVLVICLIFDNNFWNRVNKKKLIYDLIYLKYNDTEQIPQIEQHFLNLLVKMISLIQTKIF